MYLIIIFGSHKKYAKSAKQWYKVKRKYKISSFALRPEVKKVIFHFVHQTFKIMMSTSTSEFYSQPTDADKKSREEISRFYSQPIEFDPFGYSQDLDGYLTYQENCLKSKVPETSTSTQKPSLQQTEQKTMKKGLKRKTCKIQSLQSHVIKKMKHGKRLVKISISNLERNNNSEEVMVQYVTQENTDPLLEETEELVEKIVKRISVDIRS